MSQYLSITCSIPSPSSSIVPDDDTCSLVSVALDDWNSGGPGIYCLLKVTVPVGTDENKH